MKTKKSDLQKLNYNGYKWSFFTNGIHTFSKKVQGGWNEIECTEEQLTNGDVEFMTENQITLGKELKAKAVKKYKKERAKEEEKLLIAIEKNYGEFDGIM